MTDNSETYHSFRVAVPSDYEKVFSHFYVAENQTKETIIKTFLPSYQTILIFNFGRGVLLHSKQNTQIEMDKCLVLGTIRKAFEYSLPPQSKILVVNFKNDAFYRFFGNISLVKNVSIHPDDLLNENCFTSLWYELNGMDNINLQVNHILEFCKPYLQHPDKIAEQLTDFTEQGLSPIKAIAGINGQTERNIQRKQKTRFGYSVKEMNRYKRFLKAVEYMEHLASETSKVDWFAIINQCGYYDQSQLINDFKYYLALSPTKYLKFQKDICNPIH